MMICLYERSQMNSGVFSYFMKTSEAQMICAHTTGSVAEPDEATLWLWADKGWLECAREKLARTRFRWG